MEIEKIEKYNDHAFKLVEYYLKNVKDKIVEEEVKQICECGVSEEFAINLLFARALDVESEEFSRIYFSTIIELINAEEFLQNAYYKSIKISEASEGEYTLKNYTLPAYEVFVKDDIKIEGKKVTPDLGIFNTEFTFPAIFKNGEMKMRVSPNEINTTRHNIDYARGKVAIFGLGLGYFAYMCSLKKEVSEITIIEKDESIIALFEKHILPQFENKAKIKIVKADAYNYMESLNDGVFDYVFIDIYHDAEDGKKVYLTMHDKIKDYKRTKVEFWIEKSIRYIV